MSEPRKSISLGQAQTPNAIVEQLRRVPLSRGEGDGEPPEVSVADDAGQAIADRVLESLQTVFDPELPVNIVDLGLIYTIAVDASHTVGLRMTLTAPGCPVADQIVREVETKTRATAGVTGAKVDLVWSPAWSKSRMSDAALLELGLL